MFMLVKREDAARLLPVRADDMHKGDRGRLLVAGGSERYPGAPALSSLGALRSGCGIVTLMSLQSVCAACAARHPEVIYLNAGADRSKWFEAAAAAEGTVSAAVIGPGLDRSDGAMQFVLDMWNGWQKPLLVDGDGLFALAGERGKLSRRSDAVITPHEGEAARLLGVRPDDVRADRAGAVRSLAGDWGCVILKGHGSLLACAGEDDMYISEFGGAELSVPGSGDVLSGCIGAFLASGLAPRDAAMLGMVLHGTAGDRLRERRGVDGVLAGEIADEIAWVIGALRSAGG